MSDRKIRFCFSVLLIISLLAACTPEQIEVVITPTVLKKINVTVSILPQQYFVERIGGDLVDIDLFVEPGKDPHSYKPTQRQMDDLVNAQIYFTIGLAFESDWAGRFKEINNNLTIVDTSQGIERSPYTSIEELSSITQDSVNGTLDPHIWNSPDLVKIISENIYVALIEVDPGNQNVYKANLDNFINDIETLDEELNNILGGLSNHTVMVYHPAWDYFARDYGLKVIPIEINQREPTVSELAQIVEIAKKERIHTIFAQANIEETSSITVSKAIEGNISQIDPLAYDWIKNLSAVASAFAAELGITVVTAEPIQITVSIPPLKYFVERIGGENVDVSVILPQDSNPLTYKPDEEQLIALGQKSVYFTNNLPFESAFITQAKKTYPKLQIVNTTERISHVSVYDHYQVKLGSLPEDVSSTAMDQHTWMSPTMAKSQAEVVRDTLTGIDPVRDEYYRLNYKAFTADIDTLIETSKATLSSRRISKFMVLHPSMGYYGDEFKLEMLPIQIGTYKPNQTEIIERIVLAKQEGINTIFAQPRFDSKNAEIIANELNGNLIIIDPLSEDWLNNQYSITNLIAQSIQ